VLGTFRSGIEDLLRIFGAVRQRVQKVYWSCKDRFLARAPLQKHP
jgi:hypothetical protein